MNTSLQLYIILVLFYLYECFVSVKKEGLLITRKGVFGFPHKESVLKLGKNFYFFIAPFSFNCETYVIDPGVITFFEEKLFIRSKGMAHQIHQSSLNKVVVEGTTLILDTINVECGSRHYALKSKMRIDRWKESSEVGRKSLAHACSKRMFDIKEISGLVDSLRRYSLLIAGSSQLLFFFIFCLLPVLIIRTLVSLVWPYLVGAYFLIIAFHIYFHIRTLKSLYGVRPGGLILRGLMLLFSPLTALRSISMLSRDLLVEYHPVAVNIALNPNEESDGFNEGYYRWLSLQIHGDKNLVAKKALEAEVKMMCDLFLQYGMKETQLWLPPERESESVQSYCPVCHEQYISEESYCSTCRTGTKRFVYGD